ncbi:MAG TPA: GAF domain-containing protein [Vicinamibacterales bacterium]|nr:GAF domain-containing protein [Vicinamibacterales bacterium]
MSSTFDSGAESAALHDRQACFDGQRKALEAALNGAPLERSLGALVSTAIARLGPHVRAAFYLADPEHTSLHHVVGMSPDYAAAVDGFTIGPDSLACGLATHTGVPVLTADVNTDPRWAAWLWLAEQFGYRGCWSFPIRTEGGTFVGTFAIYWPQPREATPLDLDFAAVLTQTAAIIIARHTDLEVRRQAEEVLRTSQAQLELDLADSTLLHEVSAEMMHEGSIEKLYHKILDAAVAIMRSDFGSMQTFYPERGRSGELRLLAFRGFTAQAAKYWEWVHADSATTCGIALRSARRIIAPNIVRSDTIASAEEVAMYVQTGIHACQSTPLLSRSGALVGMISTHWARPHEPSERQLRLLDILARQAADLIERRKAEEGLREADRRKDEFLAILAHELRNPLAPIRTGLELLRLSADKPESLERIRPMLERQVGHMVRMIDDLLDVSRITSGKIQLQLEPSSLSELVRNAVDANRAAIDAKGLQLSLTLPDTPCVLDVDPTRFVQVISNLLQNATKFTERGGEVTVTACLDEGTATVALTVSDTGMGIDRDTLPRVFDLFVQGDDRPTGTSGLGIGLALARQLMELHGGRIEAQSDGPGQGSAFTIHMPVVTLRDLDDPTQVAAPAVSIARKVLVIDDNVDAAETLAAFVRARGGDAETAHEGESGVRAAVRFRPDVILLDIGMPGIDGYETCRRIRAELRTDDPCIVALTGWGQEQARTRALASGFDAHLTKPADPRALETLLSDPPRPRLRTSSSGGRERFLRW